MTIETGDLSADLDVDEIMASVVAYQTHQRYQGEMSLSKFEDFHLDLALDLLQERTNEIMDEQQRRVDEDDSLL